jgi:hypothetical protein
MLQALLLLIQPAALPQSSLSSSKPLQLCS